MSDPSLTIEDFNESLYLKSNPDVQQAVTRGEFRSGFEHYQIFGRWEGRLGAPRLADLTEVRFRNPIPPAALRHRVHGSENLNEFEAFGKAVADEIWTAAHTRVALGASSRVLDFGCGCGRVMNYFRRVFHGTLEGADIDPEAIGWCQHNLSSVGKFINNRQEPPLPYINDNFDLIYCISVFTHLPQEMEDMWLHELRRVAKVGALLLFTVHGEDLASASSGDLERFKAEGFAWAEGAGTAGLPSFYQTSFHLPDYIRAHWGQMFEIEAILPKAIVGCQDLVLCWKRSQDISQP
jgi:SAM-dependent methyltransferase